MSDTSADAPASRWWLSIGALVVVFILQGILSALLPPDPMSLLPVMGPLVVVGLVLQLVSPLCVYRDKQSLRGASAWHPSRWYYAMVVPPLAIVLAPVYLFQCHRYVGIP